MPAHPEAARITVRRVGEGVEVDAVNASAREVLAVVAREAGIEMGGLDHVSGTITLRAGPEAVGVILARLTKGRRSVVTNEGERYRVVFLPAGIGAAPIAHTELGDLERRADAPAPVPAPASAPPFGAAAASMAGSSDVRVVEEIYNTSGKGPGFVIRESTPASPRPSSAPMPAEGTSTAIRMPAAGAAAGGEPMPSSEAVVVEEVFDPRAPGGVRIAPQQPVAIGR